METNPTDKPIKTGWEDIGGDDGSQDLNLPPDVKRRMPELLKGYRTMVEAAKRNNDPVPEYTEPEIQEFMIQTIKQCQDDGTAAFMESLRDKEGKAVELRWLAVPTGFSYKTLNDLVNKCADYVNEDVFPPTYKVESDGKVDSDGISESGGLLEEPGIKIIAMTTKPVNGWDGTPDEQSRKVFDAKRENNISLLQPDLFDGLTYYSVCKELGEVPTADIHQVLDLFDRKPRRPGTHKEYKPYMYLRGREDMNIVDPDGPDGLKRLGINSEKWWKSGPAHMSVGMATTGTTGMSLAMGKIISSKKNPPNDSAGRVGSIDS